MKFRFSRALLALFAALTFALNGSLPALAEESAKISYTVEYMDGRTRLTLTPSEKGNTIYYTSDGSKPDSSSKRYQDRLSAKKNVVIRAAEYNKKGKKVASLTVELKLRCAAPTLTAEQYGKLFYVSLFSETEGAAIYYTTDGTKPTTASTRYTEPFYVKKGTTLRAVAVKADHQNSERLKTVVKKAVGQKAAGDYDATALDILQRVNECRAEQGLVPLKMDDDLCKAAEIRAKELVKSYAHDRPDGSACHTVLEEVGFDYRTTAENIGWTEGKLSTSEYIVNAWINSPTHYKNISNEICDVTGIAAVRDGDRTYWVQLFAKKR